MAFMAVPILAASALGQAIGAVAGTAVMRRTVREHENIIQTLLHELDVANHQIQQQRNEIEALQGRAERDPDTELQELQRKLTAAERLLHARTEVLNSTIRQLEDSKRHLKERQEVLERKVAALLAAPAPAADNTTLTIGAVGTSSSSLPAAVMSSRSSDEIDDEDLVFLPPLASPDDDQQELLVTDLRQRLHSAEIDLANVRRKLAKRDKRIQELEDEKLHNVDLIRQLLEARRMTFTMSSARSAGSANSSSGSGSSGSSVPPPAASASCTEQEHPMHATCWAKDDEHRVKLFKMQAEMDVLRALLANIETMEELRSRGNRSSRLPHDLSNMLDRDELQALQEFRAKRGKERAATKSTPVLASSSSSSHDIDHSSLSGSNSSQDSSDESGSDAEDHL